MTGKPLTLLGVGDLIVEKPNPDFYFSLVAPVLKKGDVVVGNGEIVFTDRSLPTFVEMFPSPGCPMANMDSIAKAGFNVITLAGNHICDRGLPGVEDTIAGFKKLGVTVTGAGLNIDEARVPAIIERGGTRFGFLNYNCVGPEGQWATFDKYGCAYVHIISHYETATNPGGSCDVYTFAEPRSLKAMIADIKKLRPLCDVLSVVFHKGIAVSTKLTMYDQQVSYAAIDAGADLVLGHHAHMPKGIEVYKGKVIFHGLGQFIPVAIGLIGERAKAHRILAAPSIADLYGLKQGAPQFKCMIAKCVIEDKKITRVSYLPCLINEKQQPEILKHDERGQQLVDYIDMLNKDEELDTVSAWDGDEVVIRTW